MTGTWRRSSYCNGGACVEARTIPTGVDIRDRAGTTLTIPADAWTRFVAAVKAGEMDGAT